MKEKLMKVWSKLDKVLPMIWGLMVIGIITSGLGAILVLAVKWLLTVLGVII